ncbi:hypothetical protein HID58_048404, partial [Brassica napus]
VGNGGIEEQMAEGNGTFDQSVQYLNQVMGTSDEFMTRETLGRSSDKGGISALKMEFAPYDGTTNELVTHRLEWAEFKRICKSGFGKADAVNPVGEICNLRHTGTIDEYCSQFEECLGRQTRLTGEQQLWQFCAGLTYNLRKE